MNEAILRRMGVVVVALLLFTGAPLQGQAAAEFEGALPAGIAVDHATVEIDPDAAVGKGALKIVVGERRAGQTPAVGIAVDGVDPAKVRALGMWVRTQAVGEAVGLRLVAVDGEGRRLYQRRLQVAAGARWARVELPLVEWRWGNVAGAWAEVRRLSIEVDTPANAVWLDDLRWVEGEVKDAGRDWLLKTAFEGRDARMVEAEGILVATDAVDQLAEEDLLRLLSHARKARAMVKRLFGEAARPIDHPTPAALLIFKDLGRYVGFWQRMGRVWGARVVAPNAAGYTVQDLATSTYDAKLGPERPVYVHEATHAVLAHEARLITGHPQHWWLHEGLANYVQICLHPTALEAGFYEAAFKQYAEGQGGSFVPLKGLMIQRGTLRNYAQIASIVAFLADRRPEWLAKIARTLGDGGTTEEGLERCGTTFAQLEKEWVEWGRKRFNGARAAEHFERPKEWVR